MGRSSLEVSTTTGIRRTSRCVRIHCSSCSPVIPGIFKSSNPAAFAKAIVQATTHFNDAKILAEVSKGLGQAMPGLEMGAIPQEQLLATRGW